MEFLEPYTNYIIFAGVAVVALIALSMILKAFGGRVRGRKGKRLGVSEYRELDQSRRLMLVRRDDVEHLILVGSGQSLVIEQNIRANEDSGYARPPLQRPQPTLQPVPVEAEADTTDFEPDFEPEPAQRPAPAAPRTPVFGDRAPNVRPIHREAPRFDRDENY